MPSKSIAQQKLFGMVHAAQKGKLAKSKLKKPARQLVKRMKPADVEKFARTKHKGLPYRVKKEELKLRKYIRNVIKEILLTEYRKPGNSDPFEKHMYRIAIKTLQMPAPIRGVMGGLTYNEAEEILRKKFRFTDEEIDKVKEGKIN